MTRDVTPTKTICQASFSKNDRISHLFMENISTVEGDLHWIPKRFGIFVDNVFCERKMPVLPTEYFGGLMFSADWLPVDVGKRRTVALQEE
jgi:hypothetical protein